MKITFLDFEQNIAEFESKIEELRYAQGDSALDISAEIERLKAKSEALTKKRLRETDALADFTGCETSATALYTGLYRTNFYRF